METASASLSTSGLQDAESSPTSAMVLVKRELLEEEVMDIRRIKKEVDICHMDISDGVVSKHVEGETEIEKGDFTNYSPSRILDNIVSVAKTTETEKLEVEPSINQLERDLYLLQKENYLDSQKERDLDFKIKHLESDLYMLQNEDSSDSCSKKIKRKQKTMTVINDYPCDGPSISCQIEDSIILDLTENENKNTDNPNSPQVSYEYEPDKSTYYSATNDVNELPIPEFEVDINDSLEPTNAGGNLNKPAHFSDILNHTDSIIEKIRAEEHFRRESGDVANKLIEREAGKETSVESTSDHFSQILRHTDTTIEKIRETITKNEYCTNIPEPEDRKHELIVVTSTLDKYSGKVDSPVKEELKDHELKKSEDKLQLHLVKKDGVFTIEKKSRKQVGRRKKRKTALNFKTDNCNICKFCNVSIIIFFKLIV